MTAIMSVYFIVSAICGIGAFLAIPLSALLFPRDRK
jgi:hypothetical protein